MTARTSWKSGWRFVRSTWKERAKLGKHIVCAGGLTDEQGKLKGSAVIVDFDDEAGVKEYLAHEPYVVAGVWQDIICEPLNVVLVNGEKYNK